MNKVQFCEEFEVFLGKSKKVGVLPLFDVFFEKKKADFNSYLSKNTKNESFLEDRIKNIFKADIV